MLLNIQESENKATECFLVMKERHVSPFISCPVLVSIPILPSFFRVEILYLESLDPYTVLQMDFVKYWKTAQCYAF